MQQYEEDGLLQAILFDDTTSRNRQFERFEDDRAKRLHRLAKTMRRLHGELSDEAVQYWTEPTNDGRLCVHVHRPRVGMLRKVYLTESQWALMSHPAWNDTTKA